VVRRPLVVAIDGPSGAGKSASARGLASLLGLPYLDTGAMYRAVALASRRAGVSVPVNGAGQSRVEEIARRVAIAFGGGDGQRVLLDGEDVTDALRTPEISQGASVVSALPVVRREMVRRQRELGAVTGGVVEGRDIGTVVFPSATVKIFLTAAPEVRARRRLEELRKRGVDATWEGVVAEQRERDTRDSTRMDSPLRPAADAVILDTSTLTLEEVVRRLHVIVRNALDTATNALV
jgi:CMP/dCMP kinase